MFAELFKNKYCIFLWSIIWKSNDWFSVWKYNVVMKKKKGLQHDEEISIKSFVYFYRSVTYYFSEKSLEGLKQIHQEVCSQHKPVFNLECCMIFNNYLQLRQLFSSCAKSKSCHREWFVTAGCPGPCVLHSDTGGSSASWWTPSSEMTFLKCFKGLLCFLFPLSLLPLHPPDWPWDNCAQGTSREPSPVPASIIPCL